LIERTFATTRIAICPHQGCTDTLRRTGDDSDFLLCTHDGTSMIFVEAATTAVL
jgi:hypothetical protein